MAYSYDNVPDYEIKRQIVEIAHIMNEKGLVGTYEGNISVRKGDKIYETPSGNSKELLTEGRIICVDPEGKLIEGELTPTSETPMHTAIYKLRPDVNSVVHCHAPYCTAFAQAGLEYVDNYSAEMHILFEKVPVLSYGTPGSLDIIKDLPKYVNDYDVVLLENHGVLGWGDTPLEAFSRIMSVEMLMQVYFIRHLLFPNVENALPQSELDVLKKMHDDKRASR